MIDVNLLLTYIQIIASGVVAASFYFTFKTFKRTNTTEETKLGESFNNSLLDYELETANLKASGKFLDQRIYWETRLLNKVEWFCFLVNKKRIKDKRIVNHFRDTLIKVYEDVLMSEGFKKELENSKLLPEFKELYKKLKDES